MARGEPWRNRFSFGGRLPWGVGLVLVLTLGLSLATALGDRHADGLLRLVALVPRDVWHGQIWRLATWPFVQPGPLGLIFGCLFLYWFGGELAEDWGSARWLAVFGGIAGVAGVGTCLVGLGDGSMIEHAYFSEYALTAAIVVAWGLQFPERQVRLYFLFPVRGRWIARITVALTVVFAIYVGWESYLPELFAEGAIVAWLYRGSLVARWARSRRELAARRQREARARKRARALSELREIEAQEGEAPLSPEAEEKIRELFSGIERSALGARDPREGQKKGPP
jgi:membrane associated rhomboid family serine protease